MKKKHALILLGTLLAVLVVLFAVQVAMEQTVTKEILIRTGLPLTMCALGIAKVATGEGRRFRDLEFYAQQYKDILQDAFSAPDQQVTRKQLLKAIALYNENKLEEAVKLLDHVLGHARSHKDYAAALMFLGLCYTDMNLPDQAIAAYRTLLFHDDSRSTVWSNLGLLFKQQGKNLDALSCFHEALQLDPDNAYAYNNMASTHFALSNYQEALEQAQKALDRKANLHQAASTACLACSALDMAEESQKYYRLAVSNGADGEALQKLSESVRRGQIGAEDLVPYTQGVRKAVNSFYHETARQMVGCCIPMGTGKSRFGGAPVSDAPLDSQGKPMRLLAAIYCSEIDHVPDLPARGLLQFFIADNKTLGMDREDPTAQKDFRVIFTENEEGIPQPEPEGGYDNRHFPVKGTFQIQFAPLLCALTEHDYRFYEVMNRHLLEAGAPSLADLRREDPGLAYDVQRRFFGDGHKIGGYPDFCQEDPRAQREDLRKFDTLLLQIDNHVDDREYVVIGGGEGGVINFFIPRENLKNKDFSQILYWWDAE